MFSFQSRASAGGAGHEDPPTKGHHQEMTHEGSSSLGDDTDPAPAITRLCTRLLGDTRSALGTEGKWTAVCTLSQLRPARKCKDSPSMIDFHQREIKAIQNEFPAFIHFQIAIQLLLCRGPCCCLLPGDQKTNRKPSKCLQPRMTFIIIKRAAYDTRVLWKGVHFRHLIIRSMSWKRGAAGRRAFARLSPLPTLPVTATTLFKKKNKKTLVYYQDTISTASSSFFPFYLNVSVIFFPPLQTHKPLIANLGRCINVSPLAGQSIHTHKEKKKKKY